MAPWYEITSDVLGYFSIGCWLIVFAPQIYKNYRRKSGDGVSLLFLYIWILGDIFGLLGAVQQDLILPAIILYAYYFLADAVLLMQIHYYNYLHKRQNNRLGSNNEAEPLLRAEENADNSAATNQSGDPSYQRLNSSIFLPAIAILIVEHLGMAESSSSGNGRRLYSLLNNLVNAAKLQVPKKPKLVPQLLGYSSAVLFLGARIPQLVKNYKKQSCDGLSIGMFIFSILGNAAFTLSLLLHSLDSDYLLANIPWIIGSTGTLFFDLAIFYQFYIYHESNRVSEESE